MNIDAGDGWTTAQKRQRGASHRPENCSGGCKDLCRSNFLFFLPEVGTAGAEQAQGCLARDYVSQVPLQLGVAKDQVLVTKEQAGGDEDLPQEG